MRLGIVQPLSGIGDMIIHSSHIRAIIQHYQPEHTILWCKASALAAEYRTLLNVDEIKHLPLPTRQLYRATPTHPMAKWRRKIIKKYNHSIFYFQLARPAQKKTNGYANRFTPQPKIRFLCLASPHTQTLWIWL